MHLKKINCFVLIIIVSLVIIIPAEGSAKVKLGDEVAVIEYLKAKQIKAFPEIKRHLDQGKSVDYIFKALVHLDKPFCADILEKLLDYKAIQVGIPLPTGIWEAMSKLQEEEFQVMAAESLIELGYAVVLPKLKVWFDEEVEKQSIHDGTRKLRVAIYGLGQLRDKNYVCNLKNVYAHYTSSLSSKEHVIRALARINDPSSKDILLEALWNDGLTVKVRSEIAAALVRQNQDVGRDFLLYTYDLYLLQLRSTGRTNGKMARSQLEYLGGAVLIAKLQRKFSIEPPGKPKNNIKTLIDRMEISALPINKLKEIAKDSSWKGNRSSRYDAIENLGLKGDEEMISFLNSLELWDNAIVIQQDILQRIIQQSIREIRRRTRR